MPIELLYIPIISILLFGAAYASGMETALLSADRLILRGIKSEKRAQRALALIKTKEKAITTLLLITNSCHIAVTSLFTYWIIHKRLFGDQSLYYAPLIMTFILLIFAEIIPKTIARAHATPLLMFMAPVIRFTMLLTYPITVFLTFITQAVMNILHLSKSGERTHVNRNELRALFNLSTQSGVITKEQEQIIHSIFDFGATYSREIMKPLIDIICMEDTGTIEDVLNLIKKHTFERIPIFNERVDNIIGYIVTSELFNTHKNTPLKKYIHKPIFVPETKMIDDLLNEMQQKHIPLIFVVDEFGGCAGMITLEDIAEELIGEINPPGVGNEPLLQKRRNEYIVRADMDIDDINQKLGLSIPKRGFETLAGFVCWYLGKIPKKSDRFVFNSVQYRIVASNERAVETVAIKKQ